MPWLPVQFCYKSLQWTPLASPEQATLSIETCEPLVAITLFLSALIFKPFDFQGDEFGLPQGLPVDTVKCRLKIKKDNDGSLSMLNSFFQQLPKYKDVVTAPTVWSKSCLFLPAGLFLMPLQPHLDDLQKNIADDYVTIVLTLLITAFFKKNRHDDDFPLCDWHTFVKPEGLEKCVKLTTQDISSRLTRFYRDLVYSRCLAVFNGHMAAFTLGGDHHTKLSGYLCLDAAC